MSPKRQGDLPDRLHNPSPTPVSTDHPDPNFGTHTQDAERQAIEAWTKVESKLMFRPLLTMQLPAGEDAVA